MKLYYLLPIILIAIAIAIVVVFFLNPNKKAEPGSYFDTETNTILKCPVGTYQNKDGQTSCLKCSEGTYQNKTGQTTCLDCDTGTYQNKDGQTSCLKCSEGTYQSQPGQETCLDCVAGTYQSQPGQTNCLDCVCGEPGTSSCNTKTGGCNCMTGWTGINCDSCDTINNYVTYGFSNNDCVFIQKCSLQVEMLYTLTQTAPYELSGITLLNSEGKVIFIKDMEYTNIGNTKEIINMYNDDTAPSQIILQKIFRNDPTYMNNTNNRMLFDSYYMPRDYDYNSNGVVSMINGTLKVEFNIPLTQNNIPAYILMNARGDCCHANMNGVKLTFIREDKTFTHTITGLIEDGTVKQQLLQIPQNPGNQLVKIHSILNDVNKKFEFTINNTQKEISNVTIANLFDCDLIENEITRVGGPSIFSGSSWYSSQYTYTDRNEDIWFITDIFNDVISRFSIKLVRFKDNKSFSNFTHSALDIYNALKTGNYDSKLFNTGINQLFHMNYNGNTIQIKCTSDTDTDTGADVLQNIYSYMKPGQAP
jgi:hypothetical protein